MSGYHPPIPAEVCARVLAMLRLGMPQRVTARECGVSESSVFRIARRGGVGRAAAVARSREAVAQRLAAGESRAAVVRALGLSPRTVRRIAVDLGYRLRDDRDIAPDDTALVAERHRGTLWEVYPEGVRAWRENGESRAAANVRWQDDEGGVNSAGSTVMRSDGTMTGRPPPPSVRETVKRLLAGARVRGVSLARAS